MLSNRSNVDETIDYDSFKDTLVSFEFDFTNDFFKNESISSHDFDEKLQIVTKELKDEFTKNKEKFGKETEIAYKFTSGNADPYGSCEITIKVNDQLSVTFEYVHDDCVLEVKLVKAKIHWFFNYEHKAFFKKLVDHFVFKTREIILKDGYSEKNNNLGCLHINICESIYRKNSPQLLLNSFEYSMEIDNSCKHSNKQLEIIDKNAGNFSSRGFLEQIKPGESIIRSYHNEAKNNKYTILKHMKGNLKELLYFENILCYLYTNTDTEKSPWLSTVESQFGKSIIEHLKKVKENLKNNIKNADKHHKTKIVWDAFRNVLEEILITLSNEEQKYNYTKQAIFVFSVSLLDLEELTKYAEKDTNNDPHYLACNVEHLFESDATSRRVEFRRIFLNDNSNVDEFFKLFTYNLNKKIFKGAGHYFSQ